MANQTGCPTLAAMLKPRFIVRLVYANLWLAALVFCAAGCGGSASDESADGQVFRYNASDGLASLDPAQARDLESMWVIDQLYEGLVELTPSLEVVGALARSWQVDSAGTEIVFHLRSGVSFHGGQPLTAADVVASWSRIVDPKVASPGRWIFDNLAARVDEEGHPGFFARDDSTVVVQLRSPQPNFAGLLCTPYASVVRAGGAAEVGGAGAAEAAAGLDLLTEADGTGPFKLGWWAPGVALVLHRHAGYWQRDAAGRGLPYLEAVHISFNREPAVEYLGLLQGRFDFVSGIDPAYAGELLDDEGDLLGQMEGVLRYERVPYLKTDYIGILVDSEAVEKLGVPVAGVEVRRAMSLGVDRAAMSRYLRRGTTEPAVGFVPPGMPGFASGGRSALRYDPDEARQMMEGLGFTPEEPMTGLWLSTKPETADLCAYLQHAWQQIGVDVRIDVAPSGVDAERVARGEAPLFRKSWLADYPDAENYLALFTSERKAPDGPNYARFSDPTVDSLYNRMQVERNANLRLDLQREMERAVLKHMPVIPLWHDRVSHFLRKEVAGWQISPSNRLDLRRVQKHNQKQ